MPTSLRRSATNAICRRQIQPHPNAVTGSEQRTRLDRLLTHTIVCFANRAHTVRPYGMERHSPRRGRRPRRPGRSNAATGSEQRTRLDRLLTHTIVCFANRTSTTHKGHRCSSLRREWNGLACAEGGRTLPMKGTGVRPYGGETMKKLVDKPRPSWYIDVRGT